MLSGLIVGFAFGMGAIGAVVFGSVIDLFGITKTMIVVAFLPIIGLLAAFLPADEKVAHWYSS